MVAVDLEHCMGPLDTTLVGWLVQKADEVMGGRARQTLLVVPSSLPALGLHPGFLEQPHLQVLTSGSDGDAWEIVARKRPSLIIQDLEESDAPGLTLCRRFRTDPEARTIPLIVVTPRDARTEIEGLGPSAILDRPIVQRDYFEAVSKFVVLPKRRDDRHAINLRFSYVVRGRFRQAFSRDLSLYGAMLKTDSVLAEGAHLQIEFHLPGDAEEISCGAIVRRAMPYNPQSQQQAGMAIEFEGIRDADLKRLERYIKRHAQRSIFSR